MNELQLPLSQFEAHSIKPHNRASTLKINQTLTKKKGKESKNKRKPEWT